MSRIITEYDILISCPGDIEHVIPLIRDTLDIFNSQYSEVLGLRLKSKHWSDSSYNQSGGTAQDLLNKQFIHDCDAAIAIFWTRFGSPTDRYGSGTEEEIEDMLASGKQVFLYFCEEPIAPEKLLDEKERVQYEKVKAFQKRYSDDGKGIYSRFSSDDDFKKKLSAHLALHFIPLKKEQDEGSNYSSKLALTGVSDGKPLDYYVVRPFVPSGARSSEQRLNDIKILFHTISQIHLEDQPLSHMEQYFSKKVVVDPNEKEVIEAFAKHLKYGISNDFFSLGHLSEDSFTASIISGRKLMGSSDEKRKYHCIIELYEKIKEYVNWIKFEELYYPLNCIKLALSNEGTAFDEDVDISLVFAQDSFVELSSFPVIDENTCEYLVEDCNISELFGIQASSSINDYNSSVKNSTHAPHYKSLPSGILGENRDYQEDFQCELKSAFEYGFFREGNDMIVKLHVDYIKHNTIVAFPTVLFVKRPLVEIPYTIRSKHNAYEIEGTIRKGETIDAQQQPFSSTNRTN